MRLSGNLPSWGAGSISEQKEKQKNGKLTAFARPPNLSRPVTDASSIAPAYIDMMSRHLSMSPKSSNSKYMGAKATLRSS